MSFARRQIQPFERSWRPDRLRIWTMLIGLNVAVFVVQTCMDVSAAPGLINRWFALNPVAVCDGQIWQLLTFQFLHGFVPTAEGWNWITGRTIHLTLNMLILAMAGREMEVILGPRHLLGIYLGGGFAGGLLQLALSWHQPVALVGASAGAFAVLLAFTTVLPEIELSMLFFFLLPLRLRAKYAALCILVILCVLAALHIGGNIAMFANLGGAIFGWMYARKLGYGNASRLQIYFAQRKLRTQRLDRMEASQFIVEEVDPILEKISREGIHSLSRKERRLLEKGREKIARKAGV